MVTRTGFEPVNDAVKGRCVKPLHQRAIYVNREVNVIFPNALLIYHKQFLMSTTFLNFFNFFQKVFNVNFENETDLYFKIRYFTNGA